MAGVAAGRLRQRVEFWRAEPFDDGTAIVDGEFAAIGSRFTEKKDVSDGERLRASQQGQEVTARFLVRADELTRTITGTDRLRYRSAFYEVTGTKEAGEKLDRIEITAVARPDMKAL